MAAAGVCKLFLGSVLLLCLVGTCYSAETGILLSQLDNITLAITADAVNGTFLKAGVDSIAVTWGPNATINGDDSLFKTVKVKLCYAPISQKDRAWRKSKDLIKKDKTCQFKVAQDFYSANQTTVHWVVQKSTPTAYYFIRVYAYNAEGHEVAYAQTTNAKKNTNIFFVEAVSGRHLSLDIASVCFSAFSVISLFGFFYLEKKKAKRTQ